MCWFCGLNICRKENCTCEKWVCEECHENVTIIDNDIAAGFLFENTKKGDDNLPIEYTNYIEKKDKEFMRTHRCKAKFENFDYYNEMDENFERKHDDYYNKCEDCKTRCGYCSRGWVVLKSCSGCLDVSYCSTECQKKDWKEHKTKCKTKV